MASTAAEFRKFCIERRLIVAAEFDAALADVAPATDVASILAKLVERHRLSEFQAQEIRAGRASRLFLGEYLLLDRLGAGGMGEVYVAQHRRMKRVVALKVLAQAIAARPEMAARFQREVEAAAKLVHPNIVQAYDAGENAGIHFLVMEFVDGSDLGSIVRKSGVLSIEQAVDCMLQAAAGLGHAHGCGIVHRDVKPANLLLSSQGVVKVLDMGLARFDDLAFSAERPIATDAGLTQTGNFMGTVDFMSPEQAIDSKRADARSDVYSLGCTLYYLLTAQRMYHGATLFQTALFHRESPIPSLRAVRPDVPAKLDEAYRLLVAKRPEDRPQSMAAAAERLRQSRSTQPVEVGLQTVGPWEGVSEDSSLRSFLRHLPQDTSQTFAASVRPSELPRVASGGTLLARAESHSASPKRNLLIGLTMAAAAAAVVALAVWYRPATPAEDVGIGPAPPVVMAKPKPFATPAKAPPQPADVPFDSTRAVVHLDNWTRHLGVPRSFLNSVGIKLQLIPPGSFLCGTTPEQYAAFEAKGLTSDILASIRRELPAHRVTLTKPYYLAAHETTYADFWTFVETTRYRTTTERSGTTTIRDRRTTTGIDRADVDWRTPGYVPSGNHPLVCVTHDDAAAFCNWLSEREGLTPCYQMQGTTGDYLPIAGDGYRLPTAAEWEFACRAGSAAGFYYGEEYDAKLVYYIGKRSPIAVGSRAANVFGLYDMHGNAAELSENWFAPYSEADQVDPKGPVNGTDYEVRNGSNSYLLRSASRTIVKPRAVRDTLGFRIARNAVSAGGTFQAPHRSPPPPVPKPLEQLPEERIEKALALQFAAIGAKLVVQQRDDKSLPPVRIDAVGQVPVAPIHVLEIDATRCELLNDEMLIGLDRLPLLQKLSLSEPETTAAAAMELKKKLPRCTVVFYDSANNEGRNLE